MQLHTRPNKHEMYIAMYLHYRVKYIMEANPAQVLATWDDLCECYLLQGKEEFYVSLVPEYQGIHMLKKSCTYGDCHFSVS